MKKVLLKVYVSPALHKTINLVAKNRNKSASYVAGKCLKQHFRTLEKLNEKLLKEQNNNMNKYGFEFICDNEEIKIALVNIFEEVIGEDFINDPLMFMEKHCYGFPEKEILVNNYIRNEEIQSPIKYNKIKELFDMIEMNIYDYLTSFTVCEYSKTFRSLDDDDKEEIVDLLCDIMFKKVKEQLKNI